MPMSTAFSILSVGAVGNCPTGSDWAVCRNRKGLHHQAGPMYNDASKKHRYSSARLGDAIPYDSGKRPNRNLSGSFQPRQLIKWKRPLTLASPITLPKLLHER